MQIQNKVTLITGSSSGIGQATAIKFAEEKAKVIIHYNINRKGALETEKRIKDLGGDCMIVQADITNENQINNLVKHVINHFGVIDILINNCAIPNDQVSYFEATSTEIQNLVNTDLVGHMIITQKILPFMQKQKSGKILNTSSIRGWEHGGRSIVYAVSKAGINSFTRTLAKQVAIDNIQVNAVAPGFVKTRNYDQFSEKQIQAFLEQTVLKRWVTEDEIADAFLFLTKNDAMTGQIIYVDAGFTLK